MLNHFHSDPKGTQVTRLFISQLTFVEMPEEKQTLMLVGLPRGKECFNLADSLGPRLVIPEVGF